MKIVLDITVLDGTWWYKGCAMKLLLYLVDKARILGKATVEFDRKTVARDLNESEWSVRTAFDLLKQRNILHQTSAKRGVGTTVGFTGDYVCLNDDAHQTSAKVPSKKRSTSPKSRQTSAKVEDGISDGLSAGSEQYEGTGSPNSHQTSAKLKDKETTKESSPHTPYIENNKETECPNGRLAPGPVGPTPLNQRARLCFEEVFRNIYKSEYYWTAKDAGQMTQLLNKIRFSREKRATPLPTDDDSLINALQQFLTSINKDWISNNFSVSMIASHYNEIISELKNNRTNGRQTSTDTATFARRAEIASNVSAYDEQWRREHGFGDGTGK